MDLQLDQHALPIFQALDSPVRIQLIQLLSQKKMNIKELSHEMNLSSSIIGTHIKKLEKAGIIQTELIPGKNGLQKVSVLRTTYLGINFPQMLEPAYKFYETEIGVGHFIDYNVTPSCGMASTLNKLGHYDDPRFFSDPKRYIAEIMWFTQGFVTYRAPNYLNAIDRIQQIELSFELASEFPFANNHWPSDISFYLNNLELGTWQSPGDYSDVRGSLNPDWWPENMNQYGLLKTLQITHDGTFMNGEKLSTVNVANFSANTPSWDLRFEIKKEAANVGGLTLFGEHFGNYQQAIRIRVYYT